jgi:probable HAF family extracellular repeat protein
MRSNHYVFLAVLLSVSGASAPAPVLGATIRPLLNSGLFYPTFGFAISGDGSTVVGTGSDFGPGYHAGLVEQYLFLGDLPGGQDYPDSYATDVNFDGSVVVGKGSTASGYEAFRWTRADGMQGLGYLPGGSSYSGATGVSFDGSVIVGSSDGGGAFRWTSAGGMQGLGGLIGGANDVSADGSVVVGYGYNDSGTEEAFRWTSDGGVQWLGDLPGSDFYSYASDVSGDGATVVGTSHSDSAPQGEAFRWTNAGGMQALGDLPGGPFYSIPAGVSFDGSIIVGTGYNDSFQGREAFIWDAAHGMRSLQEVLVNDYGLDLTGWMLVEAIGISADGRTILVADASRPVGYTYWIVTIPEPGSLSLLGLGSFLLLHWRPVQRGRRSDSVNGRSAC